MTFDYLRNIIPENDLSQLNNLIENKIVTENQFIQILKKSFNSDVQKGEVQNKIEFYRALYVLKFVESINNKSTNNKPHRESIKRLMSNNGIETVNEIYCHIGLSGFFTNYNVCNLYENFPDGFLIEKDTRIPIEIKSRFPKIFDLLENFYEKFSELFPILPKNDLIVQLNIYNISKKFNTKTVDTELAYFKDFLSKIYYESMPTFPNGLMKIRKLNEIEYKISFFRKSSTNNGIGYSNDQKNCIYFSNKFKKSEPEIFNCTQFSVYLENEVKNYFSELIINECIKNIKNLPPEPRVIAIYSDTFRNPNLSNFFKNSIEKYTDKNNGSCVIAICGYFNERNDNIIGVSEIKAGSNIKNRIREYCTKPEIFN